MDGAQASPQSRAPAKPFVPSGVFASLEFATNAPAGAQQWLQVQARMRAEAPLYARCDKAADDCPAYLGTWRRNLKEWKSYSPAMQLELVNAYVNHQIKYTSDEVSFGAADYWASPAQSLKGQGDCEDYAIAKYASLRELGYADAELRIVIVNDMRKMLGHAVLSVKTPEGTMILDNQNALPRHDKDLSYYAPLYSLNASGHWLNIATRAIKVKQAVAVLAAAGSLKELRGTLSDQPTQPKPASLELRPSFAVADATPAVAPVPDLHLTETLNDNRR